MNKTINEIDIVALTQDLPELGLNKGEMGTVVDKSQSGMFLIEFSNKNLKLFQCQNLTIK